MLRDDGQADMGRARSGKWAQRVSNGEDDRIGAAQSKAKEIADSIQQALQSIGAPPPPEDARNLVSNWLLLTGSPYCGECRQQAQFMVEVLGTVGVPSRYEELLAKTYLTEEWKQNRTPDPIQQAVENYGFQVAPSVRFFPIKQADGSIQWMKYVLAYDFNSDRRDRFEGTCVCDGHYYAVWPKVYGDDESHYRLEMQNKGIKQRWSQRTGRTIYGTIVDGSERPENVSVPPAG